MGQAHGPRWLSALCRSGLVSLWFIGTHSKSIEGKNRRLMGFILFTMLPILKQPEEPEDTQPGNAGTRRWHLHLFPHQRVTSPFFLCDLFQQKPLRNTVTNTLPRIFLRGGTAGMSVCTDPWGPRPASRPMQPAPCVDQGSGLSPPGWPVSTLPGPVSPQPGRTAAAPNSSPLPEPRSLPLAPLRAPVNKLLGQSGRAASHLFREPSST